VWLLLVFLGPVIFTLFFYITTFLLSLFWPLESAPIGAGVTATTQEHANLSPRLWVRLTPEEQASPLAVKGPLP
jgi:hypothetical protein